MQNIMSMTPRSLTKKKKRNELNDTGVHVMKGALNQIFGDDVGSVAKLQFESKSRVIVTFSLSPDGATKEFAPAQSKVQDAANVIIQRDLSIAEEAFDAAKASKLDSVHGRGCLNQLEESKDNKLVVIDTVTAACCPGPHYSRTSQLQGLYIQKFKKTKLGQLEVTMEMGPEAVKALEEKAGSTFSTPAEKLQKVSPEQVSKVSEVPVAKITQNGEPEHKASEPVLARQDTLRTAVAEIVQLFPDADLSRIAHIESILTSFQNEVYASGFKSALQQATESLHMIRKDRPL